MKQKIGFKQVVYMMLIVLVILACNGGALAATETPAPTNTVVSTSPPKPTSPKPTRTQIPTATEIPPTSAPVPMGTPVSTEDYEVNVIYMRTLDTVYLDAKYNWVPTAGNMFVDLGIKVVNLKPGSPIAISWGEITITEGSGDTWYPNWGEFKPVASGVDFNPKKLVFRVLDDPKEEVAFDEVVYLRAIYGAKKISPATLLFRFGESPLVEVIVP